MKLVILILLFSNLYIYSASIKGRVINENDKAVRNVNVFLSGSTVGTLTNKIGEFELNTDLEGYYSINFSHGAYGSENRVVYLTSDTDTTLFVKLTPKSYELEGFTVEADNYKAWKQKFDEFKKFFFGPGYVKRYYEIINPEVLNFKLDTLGDEIRFIVKSVDPLIVKNYRLGYELYCDINEFVGFMNYQIKFDINIKFSELELTKWKKYRAVNRREDSYNGSARHLLKSLYDGNPFEEGFAFLLPDKDDYGNLQANPSKPKMPNPFRVERMQESDFKIIYPPKEIAIEYFGPGFFSNQVLGAIASSGKPFIVNKFGHVVKSDGSLFYFEDWAMERFGHILPIDYSLNKE